MVKLRVHGKVEGIAVIKPGKLDLWGKTGQKIEETAIIIPNKKHPFKIKEATAANGIYIKYKLIPIKNGNIKLVVTNTRKKAGKYFDIIFLKTDNKAHSSLRINVFGNIK